MTTDNPETPDLPPDLLGALRGAASGYNAVVVKAYNRGFQDGVAAIRAKLMAEMDTVFTSIPAGGRNADEWTEPKEVSSLSAKNGRAPKSRRSPSSRASPAKVAEGIALAFLFEDGISIKRVHELATQAGFSMSLEGVGHYLRRNDGKLYRREGRNWFSLREAGGKAATGEVLGGTPQSPTVHSNDGGQHA